jgi:hypothetical protein
MAPSAAPSTKLDGVVLLKLVLLPIPARSSAASSSSYDIGSTAYVNSSLLSSPSAILSSSLSGESSDKPRPASPIRISTHNTGSRCLQDSLLNPLASQDHDPLGIPWVAHELFKLVATLIHPVSLHVIVIMKHFLSAAMLVHGCNLLPQLSPLGSFFSSTTRIKTSTL